MQPATALKTVAAVSLGGAKASAGGMQQATGSIVVNTQGGVTGNLSQITRKLAAGQAVVGSLTPNVLAAAAASTVRVTSLSTAPVPTYATLSRVASQVPIKFCSSLKKKEKICKVYVTPVWIFMLQIVMASY